MADVAIGRGLLDRAMQGLETDDDDDEAITLVGSAAWTFRSFRNLWSRCLCVDSSQMSLTAADGSD